NAIVSSGTTKTPPPSPTSEPTRPAPTQVAKTSKKKSTCGSVSISGASVAEQETYDENAEHQRRDGHKDPVALKRERHDGDRDAQHRRCQKHQQAQRDHGLGLATRDAGSDLTKAMRVRRRDAAVIAPDDIGRVEHDDAEEDDASAQQHAAAQHP